ncbi:nitroreductase/quinone reductase family protein [Actinomadura rayongensis]|uniref:nitroreductase/quinone reductase family protein n=1 Tax=Actinomadura rayongensis TaxID=1429076 RepID=UPI00301B7B21
MNDVNRPVIEEFRANGGRVGGMFEGASLVLLTTTGARSGRAHTTPLGSMTEGGRLFVFASNAGRDANPAWYANIRRDPRVTVETGAETYAGAALPVEAAERDRLYALQAERVPPYAEYQKMTDRVIPVVELVRAGDARGGPVGSLLLSVHAELRADLAALRDDVLAALDGRAPAPDLAAQLRARCRTVCDALGEHHDNEETRGFPGVGAAFPGLAPVLERLRREHVAVTRLRGDLAGLLDALGTADPAVVRAGLDRITADLDAHFAYEEEQLVAVLDAALPRRS